MVINRRPHNIKVQVQMSKTMNIGFILAKHAIDVNWFRPSSFGCLKAYLEKYLDRPMKMYFLGAFDSIDMFDLIGISATSQDFGIAQQIASRIKKGKLRYYYCAWWSSYFKFLQ